MKAFYRLAARLKARFPLLPLCLLLDGLFAGGPTFALCTAYGRKYLIVLQDADLPSVSTEFRTLARLAPHDQVHQRPAGPFKLEQQLRWVNDIVYVDSTRREHTVAVLRGACLETQQAPHSQPQTTRFQWITNFVVTSQNTATLANPGGRVQWKIENEGCNVQKNGGYALEHRYMDSSALSAHLLG